MQPSFSYILLLEALGYMIYNLNEFYRMYFVE